MGTLGTSVTLCAAGTARASNGSANVKCVFAALAARLTTRMVVRSLPTGTGAPPPAPPVLGAPSPETAASVLAEPELPGLLPVPPAASPAVPPPPPIALPVQLGWVG